MKWFFLLLGLLMSISSPLVARQIFLNGVEIANLRNQTLENVTVRIAANGDVFITSDQYQAIETDSYERVHNPLKPTHSTFSSHSKQNAPNADANTRVKNRGNE